LEEATRLYRYDAIFVLDPLDTFEDPDDIVWAKDREIRRVHELIVQGYYDAGYAPVFVAPNSTTARLDFICSTSPNQLSAPTRWASTSATSTSSPPVGKPPRSGSATPAARKVKEGSLIRFRCQGDEVLTRVTRVSRYNSFDEMFDHESLASVNPLATREEQLANIRQIYPPEREALGVVAIGIELIDPPRSR
jgi:ASC-1-like (ASCH) protein